MERQSDRRLIVVRRRTRLEELLARHNTAGQVKFYLQSLGEDYGDYEQEDRRYRQSLRLVREALEPLGRVQAVERAHIPHLLLGKDDVVVTVGPDGLAANTLKYLDGQPLVGVNPDPARIDGALLPFAPRDLPLVMPDVLDGRRPERAVTMARASLSDGQELYAVNDLFFGRRTHVSARYTLASGTAEERQSSSGVIVSTGLGSTGWLKSVVAGAAGIAAALCGAADGGIPGDFGPMAWDADRLRYSVREPFPSQTTGASLVFGEVDGRRPLRITSHMPEEGVVFSDGMEADFLVFGAGVTATVTPAERKGRLIA